MKKKTTTKKRKSTPPGSIDDAFTSGHSAFASGHDTVYAPGGTRKKKKPVPTVPWPNEETIIEKDGEYYEV
jgi:hypothetical protein